MSDEQKSSEIEKESHLNTHGGKDQNQLSSLTNEPVPILEIKNFETIQALIHKDKHQILLKLIQDERKIIELQELCQMNPGTIKRHIDELMQLGLVITSKILVNKKNIKEKFYRAAAMKFVVHLEIP